ncbi:hypothetical protein [Coleofasciculus sp. H7-2]|uniref:hypothetical protein n=1 Tax=Coleofasciculus sp. H7-2 TaxID=3351545 RepID=UPI0036720D83
MNKMSRTFFSGLALAAVILLGSCGNSVKQAPEVSTTSSPQISPVAQNNNPSSVATSTDKIKFKQEGGTEDFALKTEADGAKLVDGKDKELARFNVDNGGKVKIKNPTDKVLGYVVTKDGYWKIENADQTKELYILRRQNDGDYKLEDGANKEIYRIKARDYGFEIESPDKQSLYKVKVKNGKVSLINAAEKPVFYTKSQVNPIAIASFGFDVLSKEQKAALAYAVNRSGGK